MYKEFYNFSAEPFRVTPDPGFLYLTDQHKEALAAIIYGISKRKGFVCITGEVGVGKTTILKSYLDSVDEPALRFVYIYNPNVSFQTLLRHVFREIGLAAPSDDTAAMVDVLRQWLLTAHQHHETLVLLVDEAQNMPVGTLENLRLLSNLETNTEKLVQIVLVGQPELEGLLTERQLRQVESRIAVRSRLGPLSKAESEAYIRHRLRCVALDDQPAFSDAAIRLIARRAHGIPRRINIICDNALMTGFGHRQRPVGITVVREVLHDMQAKDGTASWRSRLPDFGAVLPSRGWLAAATGLAVCGGVVWGGMVLHDRDEALHASASRMEATIATAPATSNAMFMDALPGAVPPTPAPQPIQVVASQSLPDLAAEDPPQQPGGGSRLRIVAPGDTLTGLSAQVYGKADRPALDWVKTHNPALTDINRLQVGQIIEFPPMPDGWN
jgi:general secretion pathway protein A